MGELKAALEDALSGRGRLVMLVGEPGIGKTARPRSWPPMLDCAAPRCCGAAATRRRERLPTGPECRRFGPTSGTGIRSRCGR